MDKIADSVHVIGVGGAGMSGLAKLLAQMGHRVTGSDLRRGPAFDSLTDAGIDVWEGSDPARIGAVGLVVSSSAVPDHDPEWTFAAEQGIVRWRRPQLLDALTGQFSTLGATGTHGKTTSTAMLIAGLRALDEDPSFLVGGTLTDLQTNAHLGNRQVLVIEADEAFGTFQSMHLTGLTVTNVEEEHLDHYGTLYALEDAFAQVVRDTSGPVTVNRDDPGGRRLADRTGAITYGQADGADWIISDVLASPTGTAFTLRSASVTIPVSVSIPGLHHVYNATGVLSMLAELGYDAGRAALALAQFTGTRRRFEHRGTVAGVTMIDSYAHHPTEVAADLRAARQGEWKDIWAVFQPHLYSRTARFSREFGLALASADRVVVTDVYAARETPMPGVTGRLVADSATAAMGGQVDYVAHRADLAQFLAERVEEGDLVLTMGAGDITTVPHELAVLLAEVEQLAD